MNSEYNVSPNWDKPKEPPRKLNKAEKKYRETLKKDSKGVNRDFLQSAGTLTQYLHERLNLATQNKWEYTEANKALLNSLRAYMLGNEYELLKTAYDLTETKGGKSINRLSVDKGILVAGRYGVGKTTILRVVAKALGFKQTTAMRVIEDYNGAGSLRKYELGDWFIDDLGREREHTYAKRGELKLLADLLEQRYFNQRGKTIVSTNLSLSEISDQYGPRLESRLHEMFNIYALGGEDYRKK